MGLRLVSWNCENLVPQLASIPALLERLGDPDVLCLQEARVRHGDTELVAAMGAAAPGYVCHHSLNRDSRNATFRGGRAHGVVTYLRASLNPAPPEVPAWDLEGRVVISRFGDFVVGNVYAVNGNDRPYFDHDLGRVASDRHAFKRRFQERVLARAGELRAEGSVVMAGDWNVSQTKLDTYPRLRTEPPHVRARAEFQGHVAAAGMVDVFRSRFPEERAYTWFNRRARPGRLDAARVDFVLVSEDLLPRVTLATILDDPSARVASDHAPVVLELSEAEDTCA